MTPSRGVSPQASRREGVALIVVLWMLILLSLFALAFSSAMRTEGTVAVNELSNAQARAHADAGVHRGIAILLEKPTEEEEAWARDGREYTVTFDETNVVVSLQDESGRIDLNTAPDLLIKGLIAQVIEDLDAAARLGDQILDWRDDNDLVRLNGAEEPAYSDAGLRPPPERGRFESIDDLRMMLEMTPEIFEVLRPAVTVHSRRDGKINPAVAPKLAFLAIPGVDETAVDSLVAARETDEDADVLQPLAVIGATSEYIAANEGPTYTVRAHAALPDGTSFVREAVVWIASGGNTVYRMLEWRRGAEPPLESEPDRADDEQ